MKERLQGSLVAFCQHFFPVLKPGSNDPLQWNWHLDAMCQHLEAVSRGMIKRLVINVPPRSMKSTITSVLWPAWEWTFSPSTQWLCLSHSAVFATRDNMEMRRLVTSAEFRKFWPDVKLRADNNQKTQFSNVLGGSRSSYGLSSGFMGVNADKVVIDDPLDASNIDSEAAKESANADIAIKALTRLNNPTTGAVVMIMQRLDYQDPTGFVLELGGWDHLCIPMEFEKDHPFPSKTALGYVDPRTEEGELLFPERFPRHYVDVQYRAVNTKHQNSAGLYQQRPTPKSGGDFEAAWFKRIKPESLPLRFDKIVRYWDKAGTKGGGKRTAGVLLGLRGNDIYIIHVEKHQLGAFEVEEKIKEVAERDFGQYGLSIETWVEQEGGSGGKFQAEFTKRNLRGYRIEAESPKGSKEDRARPWSRECQAGHVYCVDAEWTHDFIEEHIRWPRSSFKDQVDAASGAYRKLVIQDAVRLDRSSIEAMVTRQMAQEGVGGCHFAAAVLAYSPVHQYAGLVVLGMDVASRKSELLRAVRWDKGDFPGQQIPEDVVVKGVLQAWKDFKGGDVLQGVVFDGHQCGRTAVTLAEAGVNMVEDESTPALRKQIADELLRVTHARECVLYHHEALLDQLTRIPLKRTTDGFTLEPDPIEYPELAVGFGLASLWVQKILPHMA